MSFKDWQKSGKDIHSVIADPGFVNPSEFDFRLKNPSSLKKIRFVSFDYSKAGVYGSEEWKNLARFDKNIARQYDEAVAKFNYVSPDGLSFRKVGVSLNEADPLSEGKQLKEFTVSFDTIPASFVKVVAQNVSKCPKWHPEEDKPSWLGIDEIGIE